MPPSFKRETARFPSLVHALQPTALLGLSGQPQTFTQPIVEAMAEYNERPIIFALSNPTSKSECTAEQAYRRSGGRAIFASGSPFDPVTIDGKTHTPGQGNNAYVFPGIGLGVIASQASRVTEGMFLVAAETLAGHVSTDDYESGRLYPPLNTIRQLSLNIATAVAELAFNRGLARAELPENITEFIQSQMFEPHYSSYV